MYLKSLMYLRRTPTIALLSNATPRARRWNLAVVWVCALSCSTTVWGRGFPCQPYRDSEAPVVSGPLIGRHSPAVLIPYAQGPGRGSGCIPKCYFTQPIFGCVRKCLEVSSRMFIYEGSWGWAADRRNLKFLPSVRALQRFRYHTSSGRNWIATRCPLIADLGMTTWSRTREVVFCPMGASQLLSLPFV